MVNIITRYLVCTTSEHFFNSLDSGQYIPVSSGYLSCSFVFRVQGETSDGAERNRYLVHYLDFAFDDFGGRHDPVYPGLCSVWRSLARSKVFS